MSELNPVYSKSECTMTSSVLPGSDSSPYRFKRDPYSSHSVILSLLPEGRGRALLDVGAAHGYLSEILTTRGYQVTALEGDPVLAREALGKCREVVVADLNQPLPSLKGPFDVIVFGDVLEHLQDPLGVLKSILKNLKSDGLVVISVPNVAHLWVRMQLFCGKFEYADRGILDRTHLRFFTLSSFVQFLKDADLCLSRIIATPVPLPLIVPERRQGRLFNWVHKLNAFVARSWRSMFGYQFVALAQKSHSL